MRKYLVLAIMLLAAACQSTATVQTANYEEAVGAITAANVTISGVFENITIDPMMDESNLIEANVEYVGALTFSVDDNGDSKNVTLSENSNNIAYTGGETLDWTISLTPDVPINLTVGATSGNTNLNLDGLQLSGLTVNVTAGNINATLPSIEHPYDVEIESTSGNVTVNVGEDANVNFTVIDVTSGDTTLNIPVSASVTAQINSTSGSIIIEVEDNAAVRLNVTDNISGSTTVLDSMSRVSGEDDEGVWETDGFENAENRVEISVSATSGNVTVR